MLCGDRRVPSATIHLSLSSPSIRKRGTANLHLWVVHVKMLIPFSVEESAEASFAGKIGLEKRFYKFCTWSECDKLEDHQKCKCDLCGFPSCERHEASCGITIAACSRALRTTSNAHIATKACIITKAEKKHPAAPMVAARSTVVPPFTLRRTKSGGMVWYHSVYCRECFPEIDFGSHKEVDDKMTTFFDPHELCELLFMSNHRLLVNST